MEDEDTISDHKIPKHPRVMPHVSVVSCMGVHMNFGTWKTLGDAGG